MESLSREFRRAGRTVCAVAGILLACGVTNLSVADPALDPTGWPEGVRVFRALGRHGNPSVVITNLDDAGNLLPGASTRDPGVSPRQPICPPAGDDAAQEPRGPAADGAEAQENTNAGTTIVININNIPAAPPEPVALPVYSLPVAYGGLVGPFRYPENHHFLGYGTGTGSPSMFGGLGLNSGNRFGLKTGTPCGAGFDCMFGPGSSNP